MTSSDNIKTINTILLPDKPIKTAIKLGKYNFMNVLPINLPIENINENTIKSFYGHPNHINNLLKTNKINVGPLSSYEYLINKSKYVLLDGLSISSQEEVGSVILFSNIDFSELSGKKIAIAHTSSTSVNLLKLLLLEIANGQALLTKHYYQKPLEELLLEYDAVLYIGDPALLSAYKLENQNKIKIYDLANLWFKIFKTPMVFCVWCASNTWAEKNTDNLNYINKCLTNSKTIGLTELFNNVISKASEKSSLPKHILVKYFTKQLSYNFTNLHKQSLKDFYCNLKKNNLL